MEIFECSDDAENPLGAYMFDFRRVCRFPLAPGAIENLEDPEGKPKP